MPLEVHGAEISAAKFIFVSDSKSGSPAFIIDVVGGKHYSDRFSILLAGISSCLRVSNCCVRYHRAVERVLPRNRSLRVLLLTLYLFAASNISLNPDNFKNAIALSTEVMAVKISHVEARPC